MRFCDLFISYKIALKEIKSTIPFMELPLYRKVFMVIFLAGILISGIFFVVGWRMAATVLLLLWVLFLLGFIFVDTRKKNQQKMLDEHYKPYSEKRMKMAVDVLKQYGLDPGDVETIDRLIEEAKYAQEECDYVETLKKPVKILGAMIIPIVAFIAKEISEAASFDERILMAMQAIIVIILFFSLVFLLIPTIKEFLYFDYNKYEEFMYDMRQLKIFHTDKK
ncbi:MAG: hypothetical protein IK081_11295 [Lachnospiraceae bacterium]|nr:hypothetical protein [Lachnospiraceae bacterium]